MRNLSFPFSLTFSSTLSSSSMLLSGLLLVAGCGPSEPLHEEAPPRVLERVTKPIATKATAEATKAAKGGGFGFKEKGEGGRDDTSATPENRMAPEIEDMEQMMAREAQPARAAGLFGCKRCGKEAARPGKCCGQDRHKIG